MDMFSFTLVKSLEISQTLLACTYNPTYAGGRDQEDHGWRLAEAKKQDPISKIPNTRKG
jgi:hypothetical protein